MKKFKFALLACLLLTLTGCQLAQPEKVGPETDEFIGFHIVPEKLGEITEEGFQQIGDNDRSQWVEYGAEEMELDGLGTVSFPRQILVGVYNEADRRYEFPGKEGFNCFVAIERSEDGERYINGYTDMTETNLHLKSTDEGEETILKTALYMGTVAEGRAEDYDSVLTAYRVYQMADGTVYLDGTGNSYAGGGFTINERSEYKTTVNGESTSRVLDIEFSIKDAQRLEQAEVIWYSGEGEVLHRELLPLNTLESEMMLTPPDGAVWALVQETDEQGNVKRAVMEPDYSGWAGYDLIVLNELGIGEKVWLRWEAGK